MYYVYILMRQKEGKLYIGFTPDLKRRLERHNRGFVLSTKNRRPLKLVYYEVYISLTDAKKRERFIKGGKGHEEIKIQLRESFKKIKYNYR